MKLGKAAPNKLEEEYKNTDGKIMAKIKPQYEDSKLPKEIQNFI